MSKLKSTEIRIMNGMLVEFSNEKYTITTKKCGSSNLISMGSLVEGFKVKRLDLAHELQKKCGYGTLLDTNYVCIEHLKLIDLPNDDAVAFMDILDNQVYPYLKAMPSN